jgi:molecular chaperone GrpE
VAKKKEPDEIIPDTEPAEDDALGVPSEPEAPQEPTELEKLNDRLLRCMAEYDNYRKRTAREYTLLEGEIAAKVITEFLPSLDNLERALQADCADENYKKGIQMIYDGMLGVLERLGVNQIGTDSEFNPAEHQAVQKVSDDNFNSGEITQTFQKGYKIGERVIRFAMVAVNE